jgi:hypothetical protein
MKFSGASVLASLALMVPVLARGVSNANNNAAAAVQSALAAQVANATAAATNATAIPSSIGNLNLDNNNLQSSLASNIAALMLELGICSFNANVLSGVSASQEIQLLSQMQQLAQLEALGLISSNSVQQLVQKELAANNFSLGLIKRKVDEIVQVHVYK